ncbi:MAG: type II toxin-antitoxin system RelE/ParE family toxin [Anaerolineae bacterium]|nr:type II toxin-antitoxin system RelE/ParE family toxin [Anaerolineae bacterium]
MYDVEFTLEAEEDLSRLSKSIAQRIFKKIHWLTENFELITPEPLTGGFKGLYKLRVGDYRVLYTFSQNEQNVIVVHLVKHRREVYKSQ